MRGDECEDMGGEESERTKREGSERVKREENETEGREGDERGRREGDSLSNQPEVRPVCARSYLSGPIWGAGRPSAIDESDRKPMLAGPDGDSGFCPDNGTGHSATSRRAYGARPPQP